MRQFTFNGGAILGDRPLQDLINGSMRFVARAYKDEVVREKLKTSGNMISSDPDERDYAWLLQLLYSVCADTYQVHKLNHGAYVGTIPAEPYSSIDKMLVFLSETPPASLESLFNLLIVYQDVIKYEKDWRHHYVYGLLRPASTFLANYLSSNITQASSDPSYKHTHTFFIPPKFLTLDMEIDKILESAVEAGLTTQYMMSNRHSFFYGGDAYWIFSCLITPELTEKFLYEYLTLDRKPTHFKHFNLHDMFFNGYGKCFRLNPNVQKASAQNLCKRLKRINSYHIEKLSDLICLVDDINPLAIDLMALQVETDSYQRAKAEAENILTAGKREYEYHHFGLASPMNILDKYKAFVADSAEASKNRYETAYREMAIRAITAVVSVFRVLDNIRKNEKYFGYSEWVWDIKE